MKGFAFTCIIMLTIACVATSETPKLSGSEITMLQRLLHGVKGVVAPASSRELQHAAAPISKKVTKGENVTPKSATPKKPTSKANSIVRPPVKVSIARSAPKKNIGSKTSKKTNSKKYKAKKGGNSWKKSIHAKNMMSMKKHLLAKAKHSKKLAKSVKKVTQKLVHKRNIKIIAKVDKIIKAERKNSSNLLMQAHTYRSHELRLRNAIKRDQSAKDAAILKKSGDKFYTANKSFTLHSKQLVGVEAKLKDLEKRILVSMGKLKDGMLTVHKARGTKKNFVSVAKKGWRRAIATIAQKYRTELIKTISTLAKTQAFYNAANSRTDAMSVALRNKMAHKINSLKRDVEFLFRRFLKASQRSFSMQLGFSALYKTAKQRAYAVSTIKIPKKLTGKVKKAVIAKKQKIEMMKKFRLALAKKHRAVKAQVSRARAVHRKIALKGKKADMKLKSSKIALKKASKGLKVMTVNKLVAAKTGVKVSAKTTKRWAAKRSSKKSTAKKFATGKNAIKLSASQKKLNRDMKKKEQREKRNVTKNQKKASALVKNIKKLQARKSKVVRSAKMVLGLEAKDKQFEQQQHDLMNRMKSLSAEINKTANTSVNYAIETQGVKTVDLKKAYRLAKAKYIGWKRTMAKLFKKLHDMKKSGKNEKKIKLLSFKLSAGKKRLSKLAQQHAKASKAVSQTPEAKKKVAALKFKRASGSAKNGSKGPTKVITPVRKNLNKAITKVNTPSKTAPAKKVVVKGSVSARPTTKQTSQAMTPERKLLSSEIDAAKKIAENLTQSIMNAGGMMSTETFGNSRSRVQAESDAKKVEPKTEKKSKSKQASEKKDSESKKVVKANGSKGKISAAGKKEKSDKEKRLKEESDKKAKDAKSEKDKKTKDDAKKAEEAKADKEKKDKEEAKKAEEAKAEKEKKQKEAKLQQEIKKQKKEVKPEPVIIDRAFLKLLQTKYKFQIKKAKILLGQLEKSRGSFKSNLDVYTKAKASIPKKTKNSQATHNARVVAASNKLKISQKNSQALSKNAKALASSLLAINSLLSEAYNTTKTVRLVTKKKLQNINSDIRVATKAKDNWHLRLYKAKQKTLTYNYKKVRQVISKIKGKLAKIRAKSNQWLKKILKFTNPEFSIKLLTKTSEKLKRDVEVLKKNAYVSKMRMMKAKSSNDARGYSKLAGEYKRLMKEAAEKVQISKDAEIEASVSRKNWRKSAARAFNHAKENVDIMGVKMNKVSREKKFRNKEKFVAKIREGWTTAVEKLNRARAEIQKRENSLQKIVQSVKNDIHQTHKAEVLGRKSSESTKYSVRDLIAKLQKFDATGTNLMVEIKEHTTNNKKFLELLLVKDK